MNEYYRLELPQRRRLLADEGFVRDWTRIWTHPDGRAIGEGVAAALTDEAFCRFLHVSVPHELADLWVESARA
ncbi:MAG: hypothetical protein HYR56_21210 [Acidobacteria bacterium]|nr:hypothetical protein [Acidobacteriota bacterium]MBI3427565.1 hypothetical protein [Acidobacteriota bacterium]